MRPETETLSPVLSCKFWEISKNTFFTDHLQETASNVSLEGITTKFYMFILFYQNFYNTVWRENYNKKVSFSMSLEWCLEIISFFYKAQK